MYDYLGEFAMKKRGIVKERVITEDIQVSTLSEFPCFALLMSSHWCPPCKGLLLHLKKFYEEVNNLDLRSEKEKKEDPNSQSLLRGARNFEIVYISFDNSKEQYKEHLIDIGNWMVIPYGDARIGVIKEKYEVVGIP